MTPEPKTIRSEVQWFLDNLELQLDDWRLSHQGITPIFYWDTKDIRKVILGMSAFYDPKFGFKFKPEEFQSRETVVTSLIAANWLNPIDLLQPHQSELLALISKEFGIGDRPVPQGGLRQFFSDVGIGEAFPVDSAKFPRDNGMNTLVQKLANDPERLFKTVQAIPGTWKIRLAEWYENHKILLEADPEFQVEKAVLSHQFQAMYKHFQKERPRYPFSNYTDAMAMCHLQYRLTQFNRGKTARIPKFFISADMFKNLDEITQDENFLTYVVDGRRHSVMCDVDYYIFRASFNPPPKLARYRSMRPSFEELEAIVQQLREIVESPKERSERLLAETRIEGKQMNEVIQELRKSWFLDVWRVEAASKELADNADEHLKKAYELANNQDFKQSIQSVIESATKTLQMNVSKYSWSTQLYVDFEFARSLKYERYFAKHPNIQNLNVFRAFGLIRFGLPDDMHDKIQNMIRDLLSPVESVELTAIITLYRSYQEAVDPDKLSSLARVLCALWTFDLYQYLDELLTERRKKMEEKEEKTWVLALHAAALFTPNRGMEAYNKGQAILLELQGRYARATEPLEKAGLATAVSYLFYHLWRCLGGDARWRQTKTNDEGNPDPRDEFIQQAIQYARKAYSYTREDPELSAYPLNLYVCYVTEGGDDKAFEEIKDLANALIKLRINDSVWSYRYDDTLSRYFHRRSVMASSPEEKAEFMKRAKFHSESAKVSSFGDPDVAQYYSFLGNT